MKKCIATKRNYPHPQVTYVVSFQQSVILVVSTMIGAQSVVICLIYHQDDGTKIQCRYWKKESCT